jgi:hypothetical protein
MVTHSIDPAGAGRYEKYTGFARYVRVATAQPLKAGRHCKKKMIYDYYAGLNFGSKITLSDSMETSSIEGSH